MKHLLTFVLILLATGFSTVSFAADAFDMSSAGEYAVAAESAVTESEADSEFTAPLFLFTRSIKGRAVSFLESELGFPPVHGQPLPGVLITLLLGAAFGAARKFRSGRRNVQNEQTTEDVLLLTARLLRMQISYLFPPDVSHTISPGPDLFCLRE